jgi:hypothetical protein
MHILVMCTNVVQHLPVTHLPASVVIYFVNLLHDVKKATTYLVHYF